MEEPKPGFIDKVNELDKLMASDQVKLPLYQCHKRVRAAKIGAINHSGEAGKWTLDLVMPEGMQECFLAIDVDHGWIERFNPVVGGYLVEYEDGYRSYSPAKAFESGYTLLQRDDAGTFVVRKLSLSQVEKLSEAGVKFELRPDGLSKIYITDTAY